jgi:Mg-chelatase subunit ChlD
MTNEAANGPDLPPSPPPRPRPPRRLVTYLVLAAGAVVVLATIGALNRRLPIAIPIASAPAETVLPPPAPTTTARRPRVELVFALDTTGSMSGLIEGAKRKIWSLASFVARGQPTPELRVGLVAYRDLGDAYVTRVFDLDDDMDQVYRRLRQFRADGGGDGPEHVARALHEAVHAMAWTDRQDVVKVIYLVGDAPPHTDYHDGYDVLAAAREAGKRGIQVHTIRCGDDPATESSWRRIAALAHGQYLTISQDGGMNEESTPYDAELGRLHDAVTGTALGYGAAAPSVAATTAAVAAAPAEAKADRAAFMAVRKRAIAGRGDLVDDLTSGSVSLGAIPEPSLPAGLRGLDLPAKEARIAEMKKTREDLLSKVSDLSKKREAYLEHRGKERGERDGFDAAAKGALRRTVAGNPSAGLEL